MAKLRRRSGKATARAAESGELLQAQPAVPGKAHKYVWRAGDDVLAAICRSNIWEYEVICMYSQLNEAEQQQQNGEEPVGELQNAAAS